MGKQEATTEQRLIQMIEGYRGFTRKVVYQGRTGSPDRWCFLPFGKLLIVECKAPGKRPTPLQIEEMRSLRLMQQYVGWVGSPERAEQIVADCVTFPIPAFNQRWPL